MRAILLGLTAVVLAACSTTDDRVAGADETAAMEAAWVEQDGPSETPREGWVHLSSGWYRSPEACLRRQGSGTVGVPLSREEACLEVEP